MKISVQVEFDISTCFDSRGNFPSDYKDWEITDMRIQALFGKGDQLTMEAFEALDALVSEKCKKGDWDWSCDAVALWHISANPQIKHDDFFIERK